MKLFEKYKTYTGDLNKYVDLFSPFKNEQKLIKKITDEEKVYITGEILEYDDYDIIDNEFCCNPEQFSKKTYGGYHRSGTYSFQPNLQEVAYILSKYLDENELSNYYRIYVTTQCVRHNDDYDGDVGKSIFYFVKYDDLHKIKKKRKLELKNLKELTKRGKKEHKEI